ncbi:MAG: hypothetical protein B7C24_12765 [Bacteroidetes bacterium 4572_77]|nr:MAG: hypothetical protein B7C24_12765 [Bacteroidetes bacterium 4572_77]
MEALILNQKQINFSDHYLIRASQRGISEKAIMLLMKYGSVIKKQGLQFWCITNKELRYVAPKYRKKLKNLVAVMAADRTLITCYKNHNGIKNIKKKSKYLK